MTDTSNSKCCSMRTSYFTGVSPEGQRKGIWWVSEGVSHFKELLAERDYRFTPQREAILHVIMECHDTHLTADEIYRKAKEACPEIGIATVYRTLEIFETLGIINRLQFSEDRGLYEFNPGYQKHYHHHIICLGCGVILEFNEDLLEDIEAAVAHNTGFSIVDHSLAIYGYCATCLKEQGERGPSHHRDVPSKRDA
jgi:Fur family ferric uptake transcriptional regulator